MEFTEDKAYVPLKSIMEFFFDRFMDGETFKSILEKLTKKGNGHDASKILNYLQDIFFGHWQHHSHIYN